MCIVCRQMKPKEALIRVTLCKGETHINNDKQKYFGRSAYICKNEECVNTAIKKHTLNRAFHKEIDKQTYEELTKFI